MLNLYGVRGKYRIFLMTAHKVSRFRSWCVSVFKCSVHDTPQLRGLNLDVTLTPFPFDPLVSKNGETSTPSTPSTPSNRSCCRAKLLDENAWAPQLCLRSQVVVAQTRWPFAQVYQETMASAH